ncbi:LysR substrate-binding domain-containing protein [Streptomyces sp. NPDC053542]|uniref:LysR substrate-binding domain-containing protein n=1 Tax=Streptomyces sp. NPDC053542 TaxID=3365710 RepID=UPI0037D329F4
MQLFHRSAHRVTAGELTPAILSVYRELRPDVRLEFIELTMVDQLDKLLADEVDVALAAAPFEEDWVRLRPIFLPEPSPTRCSVPSAPTRSGSTPSSAYSSTTTTYNAKCWSGSLPASTCVVKDLCPRGDLNPHAR